MWRNNSCYTGNSTTTRRSKHTGVSNNIIDALTGVAIAAAIIPPSAALGYAVATASIGFAARTFTNLMINITGLLVGGTVMSLILIHLSKKQKNAIVRKS